MVDCWVTSKLGKPLNGTWLVTTVLLSLSTSLPFFPFASACSVYQQLDEVVDTVDYEQRFSTVKSSSLAYEVPSILSSRFQHIPPDECDLGCRRTIKDEKIVILGSPSQVGVSYAHERKPNCAAGDGLVRANWILPRCSGSKYEVCGNRWPVTLKEGQRWDW